MATSDKYDRQLRLWGANGQAALEATRVLVVHSGPTGTETLKNLVLPGVGHFSVLDDAVVTESDLGNNFFVTTDAVGRPRAEMVTELLCEMNPDARGEAIVSNLPEMLSKDPSFVSRFTLVIAPQLHGPTLLALAAACWEHDVPFVACRSYGLLGSVRVAVREHNVVESHPDTPRPDLRLSRPWSELKKHCAAVDLDSLDSAAHAHVPYVVILIVMLRRWREGHGGAAPRTQEEKNVFKEFVKGASRDFDKELNFQEACQEAWRAHSEPELPSEAAAALAEAKTRPLTAETKNFWILLRAVGEFMAAEGEGLPPLTGDVPDMTSDTDSFVTLQRLYRDKAQSDRRAVTSRVAALLSAGGRPADAIPQAEIDMLCRNVANVVSLRTRALAEEYSSSDFSFVSAAVTEAMEGPHDVPEQTPALWYVSMRAADQFASTMGRLPGSGEGAAAAVADGMALTTAQRAMVAEWKLEGPAAPGPKHAKEIARYGGCEVHNVAAVVGGIASQEAVKLITKQFVPVNNTVFFNGVAGVVGVYEF